jgi:hypothetical protein
VSESIITAIASLGLMADWEDWAIKPKPSLSVNTFQDRAEANRVLKDGNKQ